VTHRKEINGSEADSDEEE